MTAPTLQSYAAQPKIEGVELIDLVRHVDDGGSMTELGRVEVPQTSDCPDANFPTDVGNNEAVMGYRSWIDLAQINYSEIEPGAIKAFHLHKRQTDIWFVPPGDRMLVVLFRDGAPRPCGQISTATGVVNTYDTRPLHMRLVLGAGKSQLLHIPPGVAHGVKNIGSTPGRIIYFTDLHFDADPARCDEYRLPWDYLGSQIWETTRG